MIESETFVRFNFLSNDQKTCQTDWSHTNFIKLKKFKGLYTNSFFNRIFVLLYMKLSGRFYISLYDVVERTFPEDKTPELWVQ